MDDRLLVGIEDLQNVVRVGIGVEVVADIQRLEMLVAVQLLIIGVGDAFELFLITRHQDRLCITTEVGASHSNHVNLVPGQQFGQLRAQSVIWVGRHMVEFIDSDQAIVEGLNPEFLNCVAEGRVGADEDAVLAIEERPDSLCFATV